MAQATTELPTSGTVFYCHQCTNEISPKLPDYICPRCDGGFIEEITDRVRSEERHPPNVQRQDSQRQEFLDAHRTSSGEWEDDDEEEDLDFGDALNGQNPFAFAGPGHPFQQARISVRTVGGDGGPFPPQGQQAIQGLLEHLISSLTGGAGGGGQMGNTFLIGGNPGGAGPFRMFNLAGNPGDYVFGEGGLDAIITQLMNQMEGTGPPPAPKEKIESLPTVQIKQEHVEKSLQCSVCFEDYTINESVRQLPCQHLFHTDCIVPWLEMHGTCPVCRKNLEGEDTSCDQNSQSIPDTLHDMGIAPDAVNSDGGSQGATGSSNNTRASTNHGSSSHDPHSSATTQQNSRTTGGPSTNVDTAQREDTLDEYD